MMSVVAAPARRLQNWRRRVPRESNEAGFTLVEVIVALAILSVGLGISLGLISDGLRHGANAAKLAEAQSLAQSLLARAGTELPIVLADRSGEFAGGYRWRLTIDVYGDAKEREAWPVGAYHVAAQVEWDDGVQRRTYALETIRLGPKAARP